MFYTLFYHQLAGVASAAGGSADASRFSPARGAVLDGQWEFYWHRLIGSEPGQAAEPDSLLRVPAVWTGRHADGHRLPAAGYASYRLVLQNIRYDRPAVVYIPNFGGAYRVYIDGVLTAQSGVVSKDAGKIFTVPSAALYPVTLASGEPHTVVVEVATTRFGGLYMAPVLKDYAAVQERRAEDTVRYILFGIVLFALFILVAGYCLSFRQGGRAVWVPAIAVFALLRIMLTSRFYGTWQMPVFGGASYEKTNAFLFLVSFALSYLLIFAVLQSAPYFDALGLVNGNYPTAGSSIQKSQGSSSGTTQAPRFRRGSCSAPRRMWICSSSRSPAFR